MNGLVYYLQNDNEFEKGWIAMIDRFDIHDNDWLLGLYENKCKWLPYFLKITFWAVMSMIQRSQSMNAFFNEYGHSKTSSKQFVK